MNIIWKQPNGAIAVTSIFDGSDAYEHANILQERGDICADWECVATNYVGQYPTTPQEFWYWDGSAISTNDCIEPVSADPVEKLKSFLSENHDVAELLK